MPSPPRMLSPGLSLCEAGAKLSAKHGFKDLSRLLKERYRTEES